MNRGSGSLSFALVLTLFSVWSATARAQGTAPPPDPWVTPQSNPSPPPGSAAPVQPLPPPYGAPAPAGGYGQPYGFNQRSLFMYENDKKNPGVALLLNFLIMGAGSIYADHVAGALIAWALVVGGVVVVVWAAGPDRTDGETQMGVTGGVLMLLSGVIYSYVDAYQSAKEYNRNLARRLGLPADLVLGPAPIRTGETTAWGPALTLRF
jgi:hypothetical protein